VIIPSWSGRSNAESCTRPSCGGVHRNPETEEIRGAEVPPSEAAGNWDLVTAASPFAFVVPDSRRAAVLFVT